MSNTATPRHQRPAGLKRFLFGAPYYPEHWNEADRAEDAARMAAAGVNVVRMAEFAWDLMEPRPGEFDFSLFDETIGILGATGIDTILCTPTATPPRWLTFGRDELLRVDANGKPMSHGSRQHCCTTSEEFRAESRRITAVMAEHFAANPHVIGWQTDNELYCHMCLCYCDACQEGFRRWLTERYGSIEQLNRAWGTAFWAQTYDSFEQIPPPYSDRPTHANPTHMLDYYRFTSDAVIEFQAQQVRELRAANENWWITHNGMFSHIDYWKFTEDLDFLANDIYPGFVEATDEWGYWSAMKNQICRAASGGYIIPEQQGGPGGQGDYLHDNPPPGRMRLWAWQGIAHGADGVLHFRWRTCRFGAEMYWCGILDHDNVPRRRYEEFAREGAELKRLGERIVGTVADVRAASLIWSDQDEACSTLSMGLPRPFGQAMTAYRRMRRRHLPCGLIDARDELAGTELLVLGSMPMMNEELAAKLDAWVRAGGVLLVTARTATRDMNNHIIAATPPGLLNELCGVKVEEFGKLNHGSMSFTLNGASAPAGAGYEILSPIDAEVVATWDELPDGVPHAAPGRPAMTVRRAGDGLVIYLGTYLSDDNADAVMDYVLASVQIDPLAEAPQGVELTCRHRDGRRLLFVLNHTTQPQQVAKLPAGTELLSGTACGGQLTLEPYGVAIIEH